jgi:hypothetical protein
MEDFFITLTTPPSGENIQTANLVIAAAAE